MTTYSNPGAIGNMPPTPNKVESTWGNAIRDRVVNHFADATARAAAIPSPVEGQCCYQDSTHELLVYAGATDGWRPPWNLPWGIQGTPASITSNSTANSGTATVSGLSVTFTAVANRRYKITIVARNITQAGAGTTDVIIANGTTQIADMLIGQAAGTNGMGTLIAIESPSAGSVTYNFRTVTSATTAQVIASSTQPASIWVEDIGPNGAPS